MVKELPKIDTRSAAEIAIQVEKLLGYYLGEYKLEELEKSDQVKTGKLEGISKALVNIFARYCEIIITRLNQVPEKNFLAFLNLLGASRIPPQAARVPLTFFLAPGTKVHTVVPMATQVAAPPADGATEPVIFETEKELIVIPASLESIFVRDPENDTWGDYTSINNSSQPFSLFPAPQQVEHSFYLGDSELLELSDINQITINFTLNPHLGDKVNVKWEVFNPQGEEKIAAKNNLVSPINITNINYIPLQTINGISNHWLRCTLQTLITSAAAQQNDQLQVTDFEINSLKLAININRQNLPLFAAFNNTIAVNVNEPYFPFAETPKFNDAFYLEQPEAFAKPGAEITLTVKLIDKENIGLKKVNFSEKLKLQWEIWAGKDESKAEWKAIATSTPTIAEPIPPVEVFTDDTKAFTAISNDALEIKFTLPQQEDYYPQKVKINGIESYWMRVKIISGNYGEIAKYSKNSSSQIIFSPDTLSTPIIDYIKVNYKWSKEKQPEYIFGYNDLVYSPNHAHNSFTPFTSIFQKNLAPNPTLFLGFVLNNTTIKNLKTTLLINNPTLNLKTEQQTASELTCQYWNQEGWKELSFYDSSNGFRKTGLIEFIWPGDFHRKEDFGHSEHYWLKITFPSNIDLNLQGLFLNTTFASQTITLENEILGSSDGSENQTFTTIQKPVLQGQQLEVKEPEKPSAEDEQRIKQQEGDDAITLVETSLKSREVWVRWHEVPDFYGSTPRDRHYTLNKLTGQIQFGDGINGLIPPLGVSNIRLRRYQTGGGERGNLPLDKIVQLKTTIPYINRVTNPDAAKGGAEAESLNALKERIPREIRHRNRAITLEDYEDLAILASPEVARAKCIPLVNLKNNPLQAKLKPNDPPPDIGTVSVIIVPQSYDAQPLPSPELLNIVKTYLEKHAIATANIVVVAPLYIKVSIKVELVILPDCSAIVVENVQQVLNRFLHPLTGGDDKQGWQFGRVPHESDLYAQIKTVPGIDYIRHLEIVKKEDLEKIKNTERFLIYSGTHDISSTYKPPPIPPNPP